MTGALSELHQTAVSQLVACLVGSREDNQQLQEAGELLLKALRENDDDYTSVSNKLTLAGLSAQIETTRVAIKNLQGLASLLKTPSALAALIDDEQAKASEGELQTDGVYAGTIFALQAVLTQQHLGQVKGGFKER